MAMSNIDRSDIMTPVGDQHIAHLAKIAALRQMTETMGHMSTAIQDMRKGQEVLSEKVGEIRTDIELMKQRDEQIKAIVDKMGDLDTRVKKIETLHTEQAAAAGVWRLLWANKTFILVAIIAVIAIGRQAGLIHLPEQKPAAAAAAAKPAASITEKIP